MVTIVTVHSVPEIQFYKSDAAIPYITGIPYKRLVGFDPLRRPLGGSIGASENANCAVTLDNGDGELSRLWAIPPLRQRISITRIKESGEIAELFAGSITGITVASSAKLEIEA